MRNRCEGYGLKTEENMKLRFLALVGLLWMGVAAGQAPDGTYAYDFSPGAVPQLWSISGYYPGPPLWMNLEDQDARGRLWAGGKIVGSVAGNGKRTTVRLTFHTSYWEVSYFPVGGIAVRQTRNLALAIDTNTLTMSGIHRNTETRVEVMLWQRRALGTLVSREFVTVPLPEGNDGRWTLSLTMIPNGDRLAGAASILFANGTALQLRLVGKYFPATGKSKLVLSGNGTDRGASLQITLASPGMNIESLRGRVGGQTIRFPGPQS
jgi:hypothetical protein